MTASKTSFDWKSIARVVLGSRIIDEIEEQELFPTNEIAYQFSARGHELAQVLLGSQLSNPRDGVGAYYRSRPLLLSLGLTVEEAFAGPMGLAEGCSAGRDIGVVWNLPSRGGATVLPMAGDVGSQYTPASGWAEAVRYHFEVLHDDTYRDAIGVVCGGDGSVATNGFWSALTMATTQSLPLLFFIEDNEYAISVPSTVQTPGGNIAENLSHFTNLKIIEGDGVSPGEASAKICEAVHYVRNERRPALLRLLMPRLSGHSGHDTQTYKSEARILEERSRDPLLQLENFLVPEILSSDQWGALRKEVEHEIRSALETVRQTAVVETQEIHRHVYFEGQRQFVGGPIEREPLATTDVAEVGGSRINLVDGVRRVLDTELRLNDRIVVFGQDVATKGGVHAATLGLQDEFGKRRVYDTSLSEEGIVGRAIGMAYSGLIPCAEIQFRKYADAGCTPLHNCGTVRWRTNNRFAAPIVVRVPGGFHKHCGDPWHSVSNEVQFAHAIGWRVAYPSNAQDAVGLLRSALRGQDPTLFFEHRCLLDSAWARRPYPGDSFSLEFGVANVFLEGTDITVVSWGAMVERCEIAANQSSASVELIDLRTISPWDRESVIASVQKTKRCLVVHEDQLTAGFGAEIIAVLASDAFFQLDAPLSRLAVEDIPIPYNRSLMEQVLPSVSAIQAKIEELVNF